MTNLKLDQEEQALLAAFKADEFKSILTEERKANFAKAAEAAFKKTSASTSEYPPGI